MAIDTSYFAGDLAGMIADLPAVATAAFLSGSVSVSVAELSQEETLILTGNQTKRAFACTLLKATTSAVPSPQQRIAIQRPGEPAPISYQIYKVESPADGIAYNLLLLQDVRAP